MSEIKSSCIYIPFPDEYLWEDCLNATGTDFADIITGTKLNNVLQGGNGDDIIHGGDGNDTLAAGRIRIYTPNMEGNNVLDGGPGDDTLITGDGDDLMRGGPGRDRFKVADFMRDQGSTTISDFKPGDDKIVIHEAYIPRFKQVGQNVIINLIDKWTLEPYSNFVVVKNATIDEVRDNIELDFDPAGPGI